MDQQFKKILQKTKAVLNGKDPLSQSFEGALFQESAWVFSFDDSIECTDQNYGPEIVLKKSENKSEVTPKLIKSNKLVMFVGDSYSEGEKNQQEDLLVKMIDAMKLNPTEFRRFPLDSKLEDINDLENNNLNPSNETLDIHKAIVEFKPLVVVSLGATITNVLLGRREKLSGIHGQFFPKSIAYNNDEHQFQLFPIFHPEFLLINPNMKRTAWIDLQKVMEFVGKI